MSTPPKAFRAELRICSVCGSEFYPAHQQIVVCSMECWRSYKLELRRKLDGSMATGPSQRNRRRKYADVEEAMEAQRKRVRERWRKFKEEDPDGYREYNRIHSKKQYYKFKVKRLEANRKKNELRRSAHATLRSLSELRLLLTEVKNGLPNDV